MMDWLSILPYLIFPAVFGIGFLACRGSLIRMAEAVLKKLPALREYTDAQILSKALLIFLAANFLSILMTWQTAEQDTAAKGYLVREDYGGVDDSEDLTLEVDGRKTTVSLELAARTLSRREQEEAVNRASEILPETVLAGQTPDHIEHSLMLPKTLPDLPVTISWMTEDPDVLDFDGCIGEHISAKGTQVTVSAEIVCGEAEEEVDLSLTVFPEKWPEEEALQREAVRLVEEENDGSEQRVVLPDQIRGKKAVWTRQGLNTGLAVFFIGILAAALFVYSRVRVREIAEEKRLLGMKLDYPQIVSKLVLFLSAGMSLRKACARITADYRADVRGGMEKRPGFEEIALVVAEMDKGCSELEAYERMGKRCTLPMYRTLSTLLIQNLTKGGRDMLAVLEREAAEAFEERKKQARVLGEQAGTKLLFPMILMLIVVMGILIIPAFLSFL